MTKIANAEDVGVVKTAPAVNGGAVYGAAELAASARAQFGAPPEVVAAALRAAGIAGATLAEAKAVVEQFLKREVR